MATKVKQMEAVPAVLASRWEQMSRKIEQLASEIPSGKFDWRPAADVRACAEVLRHVAFWNQYAADTLRGRKADDAANELPAAEYPTKARIMEALKRTSNELAASINESSFDEAKLAEGAVPFIEHAAEHYGQLVVYARLLGIVPPASR